jgi:hypothetical protein
MLYIMTTCSSSYLPGSLDLFTWPTYDDTLTARLVALHRNKTGRDGVTSQIGQDMAGVGPQLRVAGEAGMTTPKSHPLGSTLIGQQAGPGPDLPRVTARHTAMDLLRHQDVRLQVSFDTANNTIH